MSKLLWIDACVRENSRTRRLAVRLIDRIGKTAETVRLEEISFPNDNEAFLNKRDALLAHGEYDSPLFALARQFREAETVVISAPYWDLSFPAALKQYFEQINVTGITFRYSPEGIPIGLCRAKRLYYVTTAGGTIFSEEYGFGYVKALAQGFYQIPKVLEIKAEGLDLIGADVESILSKAEESIDRLFEAETKPSN